VPPCHSFWSGRVSPNVFKPAALTIRQRRF
jgi:hypothetical protein